MASAPCVRWGAIALVLDNEAFRHGFLSARQWYFADMYGEDGRAPQEPHHATTLTSEEVLRLVVMPDDQGRYHFYENLASIPGLSRWRAFVAHLSLMKQNITAIAWPNKNIFVGVYQRRITRDGTTSHASL